MGLLFISLSILCSLLLAQVLKLAESKSYNILRILVVNYLAAFCISIFSSKLQGSGAFVTVFSPMVLGLIITLGLVFIANLMIYSRSIHCIGMGISFAAMRMSLVFPIAVSLLVFGEHIAWIKYLGITLAFVALLLMIPAISDTRISGFSEAWLPVLIFLFTGFADTGMKVYEEVFSQQISEHVFLGGIFLISFVAGVIVLIFRKQFAFNITEFFFGIAAGIVNLYASVFLIHALRHMPGSVVFPLINVSLVVIGTLVGIWFWKDKLSRRQWGGLITAIVSIFLLL